MSKEVVEKGENGDGGRARGINQRRNGESIGSRSNIAVNSIHL